MRRKIFYWFTKATKLPEGCCLRWYHHILHWILFPLDSIYWTIGRHTYFRYDPMRDIIHIGKYQYTALLLEGRYLKPGMKIEIISNENNVITMRNI